MIPFKCPCGGSYKSVPDEEAAEISTPPNFRARLFHCENCQAYDWLDPSDLDIEDWSELP